MMRSGSRLVNGLSILCVFFRVGRFYGSGSALV